MSIRQLTNSIIKQNTELRKELSDKIKEISDLKKQWTERDRPRLINLYIPAEKHEEFKNATLDQFINELIRD